jgi:serine/threonine kinase 16
MIFVYFVLSSLSEVELLKQIKHPNIIELVDCQKHGKADIINNIQSEIYIVLPYFRRGSILDDLNLRAAHKDYMHSKEIVDIFLGICEGVKAMHEMNPPIAHRDLKPANVVMGDMGPVILDLGSATAAR